MKFITPEEFLECDAYNDHKYSNAWAIPEILKKMDTETATKVIKDYRLTEELLTNPKAKTSALLIRQLETHINLGDSFQLGIDVTPQLTAHPDYIANKRWITDTAAAFEWLISVLTPNVIEKNYLYSIQSYKPGKEITLRSRTRKEFQEAAKEKHVHSEGIAHHNAGTFWEIARVAEGGLPDFKIIKSNYLTGDIFTDTKILLN